MNKEIAVIIPVYNAHDTIRSTLYSVFMQKAASFTCYMVVDGEEYEEYLKWLDILAGKKKKK